jgi:hypothetical protein
MSLQGYKIPFLGVTSGRVVLEIKGEVSVAGVKKVLETFGELYSFEGEGKEFEGEYFDRRRAGDVIESLNGREMFVPPQGRGD